MSDRFNVRIDKENKERLETKANEEGISVAAWVRNLVIRGLAGEKGPDNKYAFLDDGCVLRDYLEEEEAPIGKKFGEGFYCLKKAPTLKKLGSGIESAASKICTKCQIREGALEDSRILKAQRLKGIELRLPVCTKGGTPSEDLTSMWCPDKGRYRPIDNKKKDKDYIPCRLAGPNNSNCTSLKRKTVITGKKKDEDMR